MEGGLIAGPLWGYLGMLLGAGITAFYTFRMVSIVFWGETAVTRPQDLSMSTTPAPP
ncbi:MAG: hypothetical protein M5U34_17915 [Chloroflexi bacterium]|nr:hypothetical protein [Chloroflexota bacterium]